jgi:anti-sigma-K factor RskA
MNATCNDRDRILEDGTPAEWAALETHAATCAACAEELRAWKSLSVVAAELRDYADSPALWPRIRHALAEESSDAKQSATPWSWRTLWQGASLSWQTAAASALVVVLAFSGGWFYLHRALVSQPSDFLKSKALVDVERAESAYVQAIDKLGAEAKLQLDNPETPLLANYREKLLVLDSAIGDLRAQAGQNPSNAHLRYELLAMYQEKQRTLEEVLEIKR